MKRTYAAAVMVTSLVTIAAFQNCAGKASFSTTESSVAAAVATSGDPIIDPSQPNSPPVVLPTAVPTPMSTPSTTAICDPLKSSASDGCKTTAGLIGNIYYLLDSQLNDYRYGVANYVLHGTKLSTPVVLSDFDIPSRSFTLGFSVAGGSPLKKSDNEVLTEFFALDLAGYLTLSSSYASGYYQFQTTSDDGSMLYINNQLVVNNDGDHSMHTAVSAPVLLASGAAVAIHLQYYQGPRQDIGLQVYMRKCAGSNVSTCSAAFQIIPSSLLSY